MIKMFSNKAISFLICISFSIVITVSGNVQHQADYITPVKAIAPGYPPLALAAKISGTVIVEVKIDSTGIVKTTMIVKGPKLLHKAASVAALRWRFNPSNSNVSERKVNLQFTFTLLPKNSSSEELLPIFFPPYHIEVREDTSRINPNANVGASPKHRHTK